ncbi:MAG: TetR family transcriptional regulator, partial [Deltaproteobacteria bacterium]|nr:TetR family transcriptional regulator [Deltaproteobacteria bacterium]
MVLSSDRPRARGTYKKSEASRNQVIRAAVALLAERGLAGSSVGDIARAAGLSKGAVHYHFDSKQDLLEQVLEHCADQLRERMVEAWQSAADPAERVRSVVRAQRDVRRETSPEFRVLTELRVAALHDESLRRAFVRVAEQDRRE